MAVNPINGMKYYFIDLCLPFGLSRSCALFQSFSNAIKHIVQTKLNRIFLVPLAVINNLDDFLFIALCLTVCNGMVEEFLGICAQYRKSRVYGEDRICGTNHYIPGSAFGWEASVVGNSAHDKIVKATNLLKWAINKRKVTIKFVQQLTGTLNFLNRVIVLGRAFMRGMYAQLKIGG